MEGGENCRLDVGSQPGGVSLPRIAARLRAAGYDDLWVRHAPLRQPVP
jgi:hypothetical protein